MVFLSQQVNPFRVVTLLSDLGVLFTIVNQFEVLALL